MIIDKNIIDKLTDEQKKKIEAAKTPDELIGIAKEYGHELTPDELESISGAGNWDKCSDFECYTLGCVQNTCPNCFKYP